MNERSGWFKSVFIFAINKIIIFCIYASLLFAILYSPLLLNWVSSTKSLNVCAFTETFSPEALERFQKETGIKVNITYVELDEQIFAKYKIADGGGYDVLNLSDYMVHRFASLGLLERLDYTHIKNIVSLHARLLHHNYDEKNIFCVPHKWFMYGIVYDKTFFDITADSMSLSYIFQQPQTLIARGLAKTPYKICMIDSPLDAFFMAQLYLYGAKERLNDQEFDAIAKILIAQKKWVEAYTLYSVEYFLLRNFIPIALTSSNFMRKIWDLSDQFDFVIPQEGGILVIENLVIPKQSAKKDLAHKFINFMISDEISTLNSLKYGWTSANRYANEILDRQYKRKSHLFPDDAVFKRLHIPLFPADMRAKIENIWLDVGFA